MNVKRLWLAIALLLFAPCVAAAHQDENSWMFGFWHVTEDEDPDPHGNVFEIRQDGVFVGYDSACNPVGTFSYHVYRADIYVANEVPGKGPVSVLFHPNIERTKLTYISPVTQSRAVYERAPGNKCVAQS